MKTLELGRPGAHASRLARKATIQMLGWGSLTALCLTMALVVWYSESNPLRLPALAVGLTGAALSSAMASRCRTEVARASVGVRAERRVAESLRRCNLTAIVHGATIAGGDADHVGLGPVAVLVETKYGRGEISTNGVSVKVGKKTLPRNPIGQARRQASLVSREIGRPVDAIVCISEGTGAPRLVDGVWVCSARDLRSVISRMGSRVGTSEAITLAERLDSRRG
jgi:hypothetical protein